MGEFAKLLERMYLFSVQHGLGPFASAKERGNSVRLTMGKR